MNFELLEGQRSGQVVRSERNPILQRGPNVFVKNLDKTVTNQDMFLAFSQFGNVISSKVAKDKNGISKCYGFVQFEDDESASRSIFTLNGSMVKNKILCVQRYIKQAMNGPQVIDDSKRKFTNLYVKNFDKNLSDEGLRAMFQKFGKIVSPKIMVDSFGISRGFGFVSFANPDAAQGAIAEMNGKTLSNGKTLYVCRAQKKQEREVAIKTIQQQECGIDMGNLCVSNLDDSVDDDSLRMVFQPYGTITKAKVIMKQGRSIGIGRVCFSNPEDAVKAIAATNGRIIGTKPIVVYLADGTTRSSFGEKRLLTSRSHRPNWLEIANSTMETNGVWNGNEPIVPVCLTEKKKPNMAMVFRMLSPPDLSETRTICFERV